MSEFDTQLAALTAANDNLQTALGKMNNLMTASETTDITIEGQAKPSVAKQIKTKTDAATTSLTATVQSALATATTALQATATTEINKKINPSGMAKSILYGGNFDTGTGSANNFLWYTKPAIAATSETALTSRGIGYMSVPPATGVAVTNYIEYQFKAEDFALNGDWWALSFYALSSNGAYWADAINVYTYKNVDNNLKDTFTAANLSYVQITANIRRYYIAKQWTLSGSDVPFAIRLGITHNATRAGDLRFGGVSLYNGAVAYGDVGDSGTWLTTSKRVADAASTANTANTTANATSAAVSDIPKNALSRLTTDYDSNVLFTSSLVSTTSQPVADVTLLALGLTKQLSTAFGVIDDNYINIVKTKYSPAGYWINYSILLQTTDFAGLDLTRFRFLTFKSGGGQTSVALPATYQQVTSNIRRYFGSVQIPAANTDFANAWMEITTIAGSTAAIVATGLCVAIAPTAFAIDGFVFAPTVTASSVDTKIAAAVPSAGVPATVAPAIIYPPRIFGVEDSDYAFYPENIFRLRSNAGKYKTALRTSGITASDSSSNVSGSALGVAAMLAFDATTTTGVGGMWVKPMTSYRSAKTKTASPKIMFLGDSLTYRGTPSAVDRLLQNASVTPQYCGTFKDAGGLWAEGRSSWHIRNYIWQTNYVNLDGSGTLSPVADDAAYLALSSTPSTFGARWAYNPFIRPAVGGDNPAYVYNGYIFDFAAYLSRFGVASPDLIVICLGTNDYSHLTEAASLTACSNGIAIMTAQIRAALPSVKIAYVLNGFGRDGDALNTKITSFRDYLITTYGSGANSDVLPVYAHTHPRNPEIATSGAADGNGVSAVTNLDSIHLDSVGMAEWAQVVFAWVMNKI